MSNEDFFSQVSQWLDRLIQEIYLLNESIELNDHYINITHDIKRAIFDDNYNMNRMDLYIFLSLCKYFDIRLQMNDDYLYSQEEMIMIFDTIFEVWGNDEE